MQGEVLEDLVVDLPPVVKEDVKEALGRHVLDRLLDGNDLAHELDTPRLLRLRSLSSRFLAFAHSPLPISMSVVRGFTIYISYLTL